MLNTAKNRMLVGMRDDLTRLRRDFENARQRCAAAESQRDTYKQMLELANAEIADLRLRLGQPS